MTSYVFVDRLQIKSLNHNKSNLRSNIVHTNFESSRPHCRNDSSGKNLASDKVII